MPNEQKMGLYLGANNIIQNPGYLEALREQIGLNLVIIGFCGEISPEVRALTPYDSLPPSDECMRSLVCRHIDGTPTTDCFDSAQHAAGPTIPAEGHDKKMRKAIRSAHDVGLEVWLLGEAWTADGWNDLMYCPSQERINRWYEAVFADIASNYDVEGLDITHVRFPMTSHPRSLFLCSCGSCAQAAVEMGYQPPKKLVSL